MKKIIAFALVLTFVFSLVSCGVGSFKNHEEKAETREFYESLREALKLNEDDTFKRSLKAEASETTFTKNVTTYEDGISVKEHGLTVTGVKEKYNEDKNILESEKASALWGLAARSGCGFAVYGQEEVYMQDGNTMLYFNKNEKTYTENEDREAGVQNRVDSDLISLFNGAFGKVIKTTFLENDASEIVGDGIIGDIVDGVLDSTYENMFDENVDVEYFIDGNVYTVVYSEESLDSSDEYSSDYEVTTKVEITVQIIICNDKITVTRESNNYEKCERVNEYVKEEIVNEKYELEIKFCDVYVREPNAEKYHKE